MPYRFTHGETFQDALIRIGVEQFDRARATLKHDTPDKAIHETRKCIKRLRALLRLVRSGIGEAAYDEHNCRLRDISRTLSGARDRTVLLATIARLAASHPEIERFIPALQAEVPQPGAKSPPSSTPGTLAATIDEMGAARAAWKTLVLSDDVFDPIADGLAKGLRDLQEAAAAAGDANEDDAAHDWRKTAQRHWRHMRLMEDGWPSYFQLRAFEAKTISDLLGNAQDLAVFVHWVEQLPAGHLSKAKARAVIKLARQEQASFRAEAMLRTRRLIAERPQAHARQSHQYWHVGAELPPRAAAAPAQKAKAPARKRSPRPGSKTAAATMSAVSKSAAGTRAVKKSAAKRSGGRKSKPPRT